jgi:lipopolysaccharide biosynthesis protein
VKENTNNNQFIQYKSFFWSPDYLDHSAWIQHVPFAFWIIEVFKPKMLIELGVHTGVSYFSFCQSVKNMNIDTACYAVDTWKGDEHSGFYDEQVFEKVTDYNTKTYSRFSTLIRTTFDEAREYFTDGSIDLLHIDGLHTYEAVKYDFEAWLPKMSEHGIVLFHDINVREKNFGVFKFWEELKQKYPHFQFDFGHGLGVLAIGKIPEELNSLFDKTENNEFLRFLTNIFSERGIFFQTNFYNDLALNQERNNVREQQEINRRLIEDNSLLQEDNHQLRVKIQQLETDNKKLLNSVAQLKKHSETLETTNKKLQENNQKEKNELLKKLEQVQHTCDNLSELLSESKQQNELLKKDIVWYRDTYETRSIAGVLKEKIMTKRKKSPATPAKDNVTSEILSKSNADDNHRNDTNSNETQEKGNTGIVISNKQETPLLNGKMLPSAVGALKIRHQVIPSYTDVCLFSSFSFSGKIEDYVFYYLAELKKAGLSIAFISTSPLMDSCVERLSQYAFLIIERENCCPDFGSWKAALSLLNWGKNLNSILLANDSVFGPFYELRNIISSMRQKYDVWGMTDSYEIAYHLQSYFLYFNKRAIKNPLFAGFFQSVNLSATKNEVIRNYEVGLSQLLSNSLKLGAYANFDVISKNTTHGHRLVNPALAFWRSLIKTNQFPFFKRELIIKPHISTTYDDYRDLYINVGGWKKIIDENSLYPIKNITEFINNYYQVINSVNKDIVLQKRKILFISKNSESGKAQRILFNFLQWLKKNTDIAAEVILCSESVDDLTTEFSNLAIVTKFYTLSEKHKKNLKKRLIDEVALIFSNTIEYPDVQKFFAFLDVPQIVFLHKPISAGDGLLNDENINWIKNNISKFIARDRTVRKSIVECLGIDSSKIALAYEFANQVPVKKIEKAFSDPFHWNGGNEPRDQIAKKKITTDVSSKLFDIISAYYDNEEVMFKDEPVLAFMTHIYYDNSWEEIRLALKNFDNGKNYFFFSISEACLIEEQIIDDIQKSFNNAFFLVTSNIGKDIGGKLALIDLYLLLNIQSSFIIFLHDKQSLHSIDGENWKNSLFKVIDLNNEQAILNLFKDPKTGMVGAKEYIINEYESETDTFRNNDHLSKKLIQQFGIAIKNYDFLGGSIYWIRSSIIEKFFKQHHPIQVRENLEAGNVLDLYGERLTHTWERMFSWITANEGYVIKGI